jgi:RNA polymerase sigma-70 factor, ECF subfamily
MQIAFSSLAVEPSGFGVRSRGMTVASSRRGQPTVDDVTLARLYDDHATVLLAYATRLSSGDVQRAEDAVQETLLRAWRHPEAFEPGRGSPRAWLMTVLRHVVVDDARARKARPREVGGEHLDIIAVRHDDIEDALQSWTVAEALAALTPDHRAVLVETYYRGRTVAEAAVELGVPPGTVKSRTFYALRALRLALSERGVTP